MRLICKTIFHEPAKNCRIRGKRSDWAGLPKSKSLFFAGPDRGLPIGNLTSQLFGNVYLSDFDHFIKGRLGIRCYGRYVDDLVMVHPDKDFLKSLIPEIKNYLKDRMELELHEKKIYLQHFSKGVKFLGAVIKPYRIYIDRRTKGNFYARIKEWNIFIKDSGNRLSRDNRKKFIAVMNSYLGLLKRYRTAKLRQKLLGRLSMYFYNYAYIGNDVLKKARGRLDI